MQGLEQALGSSGMDVGGGLPGGLGGLLGVGGGGGNPLDAILVGLGGRR